MQRISQLDSGLLSHALGSAALLTMLGLDPATVVEVKRLTAHARSLPVRGPISLLHLTQTCVDFWATPRRFFFELLSQHCRCNRAFLLLLHTRQHLPTRSDEMQRERLLYFSSPAGRDELHE